MTAKLTTVRTGSRRKPKVIALTVKDLGRGRGQVMLPARGRKRREALRRRQRPLAAELQVTIAGGATRTALGRRVKLTV